MSHFPSLQEVRSVYTGIMTACLINFKYHHPTDEYRETFFRLTFRSSMGNATESHRYLGYAKKL